MDKIVVATSVSIVMPMRNASTTILYALNSIEKQTYPVSEITIIDNASEDNSVSIVNKITKKFKIPIRLITRKKNKGVGINFNLGVTSSKSELVILMHSDCTLSTESEIEKLTKPLREDAEVVAAFPTIVLQEAVWKTYDFWEKYFFARQVGKKIAGLTTKFDCIRREVYQKVGGFDMKNFGVGAEDADLHQRLKKAGKVVKSTATVSHLHYLGKGYTLSKLLSKQKAYAKGYGRAIRIRGTSIVHNGIILLVKPTLAILPFLPFLQMFGVLLLILYAFLYTRKMFTTKSTLRDARILTVPFINIFFIYYETFWMAESFLFGKNKIE